MRYTTVSVDVDLDDVLCNIATDDLIDELKIRDNFSPNVSGLDGSTNLQILDTIHQKRRLNQNYQLELDMLIYNVLGKIL